MTKNLDQCLKNLLVRSNLAVAWMKLNMHTGEWKCPISR